MKGGLITTVVLTCVGCVGATDPLSWGAVSSIPAGNATGEAKGGELIFERQLVACTGTCSVMVDGRPLVFCIAGQFTNDPVAAEQHDGAFKLHFERSSANDGSFVGWDYTDELPVAISGGINVDESFDVGGVLSPFRDGQGPKWPGVTARLTGSISSQMMTADLRTRRTDSVLADDGTLVKINCEANETVSALWVR